jgi:hypothetical protein
MGFHKVLAIVATYGNFNRPVWQSFVFLILEKGDFDKKEGGINTQAGRTCSRTSSYRSQTIRCREGGGPAKSWNTLDCRNPQHMKP